jgi:hypothetical protein
MFKLIFESLELLLFLSFTLTDQLLHFDLIFWLFCLDLCNFFIVNLLQFLKLSIKELFLFLILISNFLCMLLHFFSNYLIFQSFYLILEQYIKLIIIVYYLLLFFIQYFYLLLELILNIFLSLF